MSDDLTSADSDGITIDYRAVNFTVDEDGFLVGNAPTRTDYGEPILRVAPNLSVVVPRNARVLSDSEEREKSDEDPHEKDPVAKPGDEKGPFGLSPNEIHSLFLLDNVSQVDAVKKHGSFDGFADKLSTDLSEGLSMTDVRARVTIYGRNDMPVPPPRSFASIFRAAILDKTLMGLAFAAVLSVVLNSSLSVTSCVPEVDVLCEYWEAPDLEFLITNLTFLNRTTYPPFWPHATQPSLNLTLGQGFSFHTNSEADLRAVLASLEAQESSGGLPSAGRQDSRQSPPPTPFDYQETDAFIVSGNKDKDSDGADGDGDGGGGGGSVGSHGERHPRSPADLAHLAKSRDAAGEERIRLRQALLGRGGGGARGEGHRLGPHDDFVLWNESGPGTPSPQNNSNDEPLSERNIFVESGWVTGIALWLAILAVAFGGSTNIYYQERLFHKLAKGREDRHLIVVRRGCTARISSKDLLVGDLIQLQLGAIVPADGILVKGKDMRFMEFDDRGDEEEVTKTAVPGSNVLVTSGSYVIGGHGFMIALAVGEKSLKGRRFRQDTFADVSAPEESVQAALTEITSQIGRVGLFFALLFFVLLGTKYFVVHTLNNELIVASLALPTIVDYVIIAVALVAVAVPEGLLLTMTLALAFSMRRMFKEKNMVKNIESIERLARCTSLCIDKTAVVTENVKHVVAGYYGGYNIYGDGEHENLHVLALKYSLYLDLPVDRPSWMFDSPSELMKQVIAVNSNCHQVESWLADEKEDALMDETRYKAPDRAAVVAAHKAKKEARKKKKARLQRRAKHHEISDMTSSNDERGSTSMPREDGDRPPQPTPTSPPRPSTIASPGPLRGGTAGAGGGAGAGAGEAGSPLSPPTIRSGGRSQQGPQDAFARRQSVAPPLPFAQSPLSERMRPKGVVGGANVTGIVRREDEPPSELEFTSDDDEEQQEEKGEEEDDDDDEEEEEEEEQEEEEDAVVNVAKDGGERGAGVGKGERRTRPLHSNHQVEEDSSDYSTSEGEEEEEEEGGFEENETHVPDEVDARSQLWSLPPITPSLERWTKAQPWWVLLNKEEDNPTTVRASLRNPSPPSHHPLSSHRSSQSSMGGTHLGPKASAPARRANRTARSTMLSEEEQEQEEELADVFGDDEDGGSGGSGGSGGGGGQDKEGPFFDAEGLEGAGALDSGGDGGEEATEKGGNIEAAPSPLRTLFGGAPLEPSGYSESNMASDDSMTLFSPFKMVTKSEDLSDDEYGLQTDCVGRVKACCTRKAVVGAVPEVPDDPARIWIGSSTDLALLRFVWTMLGSDRFNLHSFRESLKHSVVHVYAFSPTRKKMGVVLRRPEGGYRYLVKGASEEVVTRCDRILHKHGRVIPLDQKMQLFLGVKIHDMARDNYHTMGLAYCDFDTHVGSWDEPPELPLICLGVVGLLDPIRPGVKEAVESLQKAGIKVRLVTGDLITTAKAVAFKIGILSPDGYALEGFQLRSMSHEEMASVTERVEVVARALPTDKYLLVDNLMKEHGECVVVTGDSWADTRTVKLANIGLGLGTAGAENTKEASDIIVMDDQLSTIVRAIMWGRCFFDSLQKFIQFQLTVNIVTVSVTAVGALRHDDGVAPLSALQLLWINLIMDSLAALALATEMPTSDLLNKLPVVGNKLISRSMILSILSQYVYQVVALLLLLEMGHYIFLYPLVGEEFEDASDSWRFSVKHFTIIFNTLVFMQVFNFFNCRKTSQEENILNGITSSRLFQAVIVAIVGIQIFLVEYGGVWAGTTPLSDREWGLCLAIASGVLLIGVLSRLLPIKDSKALENVAANEHVIWRWVRTHSRTQARVNEAFLHLTTLLAGVQQALTQETTTTGEATTDTDDDHGGQDPTKRRLTFAPESTKKAK